MEVKQVIIPNDTDEVFNIYSYCDDTKGLLIALKKEKAIGFIYTADNMFYFSDCPNMNSNISDFSTIKSCIEYIKEKYQITQFIFIPFCQFKNKYTYLV